MSRFPPCLLAAQFLVPRNIHEKKAKKLWETERKSKQQHLVFFLAVQTRHGAQESGSTVTRVSETIRIKTIPSVTFPAPLTDCFRFIFNSIQEKQQTKTKGNVQQIFP